MKTKNTPGPWYTLGKSVMYNEINTVNGRDSRQRQLAEVYTVNGESDARLIAAAPELLAALISCRDSLAAEIRSEYEGTSMYQERLKELEPIDAVITKATGEQS